MIGEKELKDKILKILKKDTIIKSSTGFLYLYDAILLCFKDRTLLDCMNKELFVRVAELEDTTAKKVANTMRYAISTSELGKTISECILTVLIMLKE